MPDRIVDHEAEYSNTTFAALAEVWNREHVGSGMKMEEARTLDGIEAHIKNCVDAMQAARSSQPYKLLFPIQEGGNHWVGVMVSNDGQGNISIVANDPLGADGGERTANLDVALQRTKIKLEEGISGVTVNEPIRDSVALQQSDKKACGPYVFENLTAAAVGGARSQENPGRIALREKQLGMLPDRSEYAIKEISISEKADDALKILGERLHQKGVEQVNKDQFMREFQQLDPKLQQAIAPELTKRTPDGAALEENHQLVLSRVNFHIAHDENGLRPDVLKHKLTTITNTMKEFVESGLEIEQARQVAGLSELIEQFKTNKDVDKLPPEVFAKVTNPGLYSERGFIKSVTEASASADIRRREGVADIMQARQEVLDSTVAVLLGRKIEVDGEGLKNAIEAGIKPKDIAHSLGMDLKNTEAMNFLSDKINAYKALTLKGERIVDRMVGSASAISGESRAQSLPSVRARSSSIARE